MKKQIVINASKDRSRIAIVEDGELVELYVENPENVRTLGNIYLGSVQKVMPAIRASFVDVGQKQDCFLHFSDLTDNFPQLLTMAGVEVPGLDKPMLSLAPKKQVSDDEFEPDIEDKLEIEDDTEAAAEKPRSSRGRRSRGRGGRGRGRSAGDRNEEEEEQEEEADEKPRRLPMVIDLSAKPSRPAPKPAPKPTPAPAEPADADEEAAPEKPKRARASRAKKTDESTEDARDDSGTDAPAAEEKPKRARASRAKKTADAPGGDTAEDGSEAAAAEEKRKRARASRAKKTTDATEGDTAEDGSEAAPAEEKPKRARASRAKKAVVSEPEASEADADAASEEAPARPPRTRAKRSKSADTDDAAEAAVDPQSESPETADSTDDESDDSDRPRRRRRGGRGRGRGSNDAEQDASDDSGDPQSDSSDADGQDEDTSRRSRGGRSRSSSPTSDSATDTEAAAEPPRERRRSRSGSDETGASPAGRSGRDRSGESDAPQEGGSRRSSGDSGRRDRGGSNGRSGGSNGSSGSVPSNEQLLKRGSPVIVKITKEPISTKGSRASTDLSIAGRFLVLVPAADYVAVSKKIESAKERRRLRTVASSLKPEGFGVIVRTVAEGRDAKALDTDMRLLTDKWRKIEKKLAEKPKPPVLLYEDVNMVSSIIRDLFSEDYDQIIVDDPRVFKNVQTYVRAIAPAMADKVLLHTSATPVFRALSIERQVEEAFSKRVNMKGGGYLFIETTEAMHVVDVNSGRAGRGKSQKDNLIAVNVEAAKEVAKQLRLRDLGGIIVIDFIDLRHESDRRKVTSALKEAFAKDRAVTKLLPMSDFGLVQITRQRLRPSITSQASDDGSSDPAEAARLAGASEIEQPERGYAHDEPEAAASYEPRPEPTRSTLSLSESTPEALTATLRGWLDNYRKTVDATYKARPIVVRVHPLFAAFLKRGFPSPLTRWRLTIRGISYRIEEDTTVDPLAFDVRDDKSGRTLMKKYNA